MTKQMRELTDSIYLALFGKDTIGLLEHYGIASSEIYDVLDTALRDCMSTEELQALNGIEREIIESLKAIKGNNLDFEDMRKIAENSAARVKLELQFKQG